MPKTKEQQINEIRNEQKDIENQTIKDMNILRESDKQIEKDLKLTTEQVSKSVKNIQIRINLNKNIQDKIRLNNEIINNPNTPEYRKNELRELNNKLQLQLEKGKSELKRLKKIHNDSKITASILDNQQQNLTKDINVNMTTNNIGDTSTGINNIVDTSTGINNIGGTSTGINNIGDTSTGINNIGSNALFINKIQNRSEFNNNNMSQLDILNEISDKGYEIDSQYKILRGITKKQCK